MSPSILRPKSPGSSGVERVLGKDEVTGSIPVSGSSPLGASVRYRTCELEGLINKSKLVHSAI